MKTSLGKRRDMNYHPELTDTYQNRGKKTGPMVCTACGAFYQAGRWSWEKAPPGTDRTFCPACRRVRDKYPAGTLELSGAFLALKRQEIESLIRHEEEAESKEHPLERIIATSEERERTLVTTTGIHLARRLGEALTRAYQGKIAVHYGEGERDVRITWSR
jgi:hypothetical protein